MILRLPEPGTASEPNFGKIMEDRRAVVRVVCGDWSLVLSSCLETFAAVSDQ
jgi:hypothetical protein